MEQFQRRLLVFTLILVGLAGLVAWLGGERGPAARWLEDLANLPGAITAVQGRQVGIIAGHRGHDSGAICPDGLTEAETVQAFAEGVVGRLSRLGARVELLSEYDQRLNGYVADVVVSIHADACVERSGFKTARAEDSAMAGVEDLLVDCLNRHYATATGLQFDPYTVTEDMIGYHAFRRVAAQTPAAIIETGFLGGDRRLLTRHADVVARGITNGIVCFLEGS